VADATLNKVRASAPVVLADASMPASRLVDVVEALGDDGARLGVTYGRGDVGEHAIWLTTRPLTIGAMTSHISLQHLGAPREKGMAKRGVVVWINVQNATVQELVDEMNQLYEQGVHLIVLDDQDLGLTPTTRGTLDKESIRPVITAHLADVRHCYEAGLKRHPIAGRVLVQFAIGADGKVAAATVQDSTLADASVEYCITEAMRTWTFPQPNGTVVVSYPFVLKMPDKK
jgi:TonB family protein